MTTRTLRYAPVNSATYLSTGEQVNAPKARSVTYRQRGIRTLDDLTLNRARFMAEFITPECSCSDCRRRRELLADLLL